MFKNKILISVLSLILLMGFGVNIAYAQTKDENEKELIVSPLATEESSAKATVTENINEAGDDFIIKGLDDNGNIKKLTRQFISFETKSGKTLHLIIDHDKASNNVILLTEVSEFDLLNMVELDEKDKKNDPKSLLIEDDKIEKQDKTEEIKEENKEEPEPKKKNKGSFFLIIIIAIGVGLAGYYFKIVKPKQNLISDEYDSEDESEYPDDYDYNDEDDETDDYEEEAEYENDEVEKESE